MMIKGLKSELFRLYELAGNNVRGNFRKPPPHLCSVVWLSGTCELRWWSDMDDSTAPVTPTSLARQIKNPLSIRLSHIYNTVLHNSDKTKNALTTLSEIPNLQHQDLDKNLRGVLERNALEANQRFLLAFSKLDEVTWTDRWTPRFTIRHE